MNHKRRRPKHRRAGCLMCKPWKDERGNPNRGQTRNLDRKFQDSPADLIDDEPPFGSDEFEDLQCPT